MKMHWTIGTGEIIARFDDRNNVNYTIVGREAHRAYFDAMKECKRQPLARTDEVMAAYFDSVCDGEAA